MSVRSIELTRRNARPSSWIKARSSFALAVLVGAAFFLAMISGPVMGAQINYGTFAGEHVDYINVTEDSGNDEPLPLFGPPTVTGNSIDFNPVGFDASSMNGGADITDSNLVFMVASKSGSRISSLTFSESGDTTLAGNVPMGSTGTATSVTATGVIDIHEIDVTDNGAFDPIGINHISVPFSLTFTPSGGTYFLGTDGAGGPLYHTQWSGTHTINIDAILAANGITVPPGPLDPNGGATKISIDLDNTLTAVSQDGTSAHIAKKDFGGITIRANVPTEPGGDPEIPEPSTIALLGLSLLGVVCGRGRATQ
jgi:hypothetical protein